jgi:enhancing lycopene biosynthesis protein 2
MFQAGILISGCGLYDGTEPHEAVLAMLALDRGGFRYRCLVPDLPQMHAVDHTTGNEREGDRRNMMEEAARMSRGRVFPLCDGSVEEIDALVVPGGYGCAKNLMEGFAEPGKKRKLLPDVDRLLRGLLEQKKPLGLISLADLLIYPLLPDLEKTLSAWQSGTDPVLDRERKVVYTPGYRGYDRIGKVSTGIRNLVEEIARFLEQEP